MAVSLNVDGFIKRANSVHGDRFRYDKVNYVNGTTPVTITCKEHGDCECLKSY